MQAQERDEDMCSLLCLYCEVKRGEFVVKLKLKLELEAAVVCFPQPRQPAFPQTRSASAGNNGC